MSTSRRLIAQSIIALGILWMLFALLYPPYSSKETSRDREGRIITQYNTPLGHYWLWKPPQGSLMLRDTSEPYIDTQHLATFLAIGLVVIGAGAAWMRITHIKGT